MSLSFLALFLMFLVSCDKNESSAEPEVIIPDSSEITTYSSSVSIRGGDISELTYVEQNGGKYYFENQAMDCLEILRINGINTVRIRLYNDPGNPAYTPSNRLPAGIQNPADVLSLARRAKEKGMQIVLSFHYSDYWTNGETQTVPHQWSQCNYAQLCDSVYAFTANFLQQMKAQGTLPEFVAIGNETQAGMLYPFGSCNDMQQMTGLFKAASKGVREAAPSSKIIIHSDDAGNTDKYEWYFGAMIQQGVDFDIIGASYYPYWTGRDCKTVCEWADRIIGKFNKDLLFMETGYAWTPNLPDGSGGQLSHNKPYTNTSKAGQKDFMIELNRYIANSSSHRILGYLYWDPIFIEANGIGWELGAKNVVSNTTFFDFGGHALPVLEAFH